MRARIYQRPKTATQSGTAGTASWVLDFQTRQRQVNEPLMGWWGSSDTLRQVRLEFDSCDQAKAYAEQNATDHKASKGFSEALTDSDDT